MRIYLRINRRDKMSAYIVDNKTISAIAKAFDRYHVDYAAEDYERPIQIIINVRELRQGIGQSLLNQNYRSVNYRYNEDTEVPVFEYEDVHIDEGIVYGCIQCYEYQACETSDYYESQLHYSLVRMKSKLTERLLKRCVLAAPYGYDGFNILE